METTKKIGMAIESAINSCSCNPYNVAKYMACYTHRYLCNEFFKIAIFFIRHLSDNYDNGCYDGRNEYACKASKEITNMIQSNQNNDYFRGIESSFNYNKSNN